MVFLRHVISRDGIIMELRNIEAIVNWANLINVSKVRRFLGLAGCYRRFVEGFSSVATPMTQLTRKKNAKFDWTDECERSYEVW